ncbi:MAG: hypothetical protein LE178_04070 [Endomicrobium sp.]|nr:hypothetical protein [Endomicrobium sp.]
MVRDLGDLLECEATVKTLRRDVIGVFDVKML